MILNKITDMYGCFISLKLRIERPNEATLGSFVHGLRFCTLIDPISQMPDPLIFISLYEIQFHKSFFVMVTDDFRLAQHYCPNLVLVTYPLLRKKSFRQTSALITFNQTQSTIYGVAVAAGIQAHALLARFTASPAQLSLAYLGSTVTSVTRVLVYRSQKP
jgi:hypothetical protein